MKNRFIQLIAPVIYKHLCEVNGMQKVSQEECVKNIQLFAGINLLPQQPELFYFGSWQASPEYDTFDFTGYQTNYQNIIDQFTKEKALQYIINKLEQKIQIWIKTDNYLGYIKEPEVLTELANLKLPYVKIAAENYIYITPSAIIDKNLAEETMRNFFQKWRLPIGNNFSKLFENQERKYIKIASWLNPALAQEIRELKIKHRNELSQRDRSKDKLIRTPVLYSLVLEPFTTRYYPYWDFMSHILGYVDKGWVAYYGIEEYFDSILRGKKGEIRGRTSAWLGNVGSNEFEIAKPINGNDIYLTIDIGLQREVERIAKEQQKNLKADAISILVLNTQNGELKASVNAPTFDPNNYNDAYTLVPLGKDQAEVIDNLSYIDIPLYIMTGGKEKLAKISERANPEIKKYIPKNRYGSQVFIDRNISMPFEPWSIFKAFTVAIGLDTDEIKFNDHYLDEGFVKVHPFTIKNASSSCLGENSFLHSLIYSCNVGMVRIVQKIGKHVFYNYMNKLGFWELTNIELAGEKEGKTAKNQISDIALVNFFNNSFGQGILTTQIQLAIAYATVLNWGEMIKPTIIKTIIDKEHHDKKYTKNQDKKTIFKKQTAQAMQTWLFEVMNTNTDYRKSSIEGIKLWGKSGTAQISFKGKYQAGEGRTNGTFAGIISTEDPKYVVLIWIRRPRTNQWWGNTAGPIFKQIAQYLLSYDM